VETRLLSGAAAPGWRALFQRAGIEVEAWPHAEEDMQYTCSPAFAQWLRPRIADADVVHGHMFGVGGR
jgi:hypothetical protein